MLSIYILQNAASEYLELSDRKSEKMDIFIDSALEFNYNDFYGRDKPILQ